MDIKELDKFQRWFNELPKFEKGKDHVGESYYGIVTNLPPAPMVVDLTEVNGKTAIIFQYPTSSFAKEHNVIPDIRIYYPDKIQTSFRDYDSGKYMFSAKVDDKFWFFDERIKSSPVQTSMFGMDMTMPFLNQQEWEDYEVVKSLIKQNTYVCRRDRQHRPPK